MENTEKLSSISNSQARLVQRLLGTVRFMHSTWAFGHLDTDSWLAHQSCDPDGIRLGLSFVLHRDVVLWKCDWGGVEHAMRAFRKQAG